MYGGAGGVSQEKQSLATFFDICQRQFRGLRHLRCIFSILATTKCIVPSAKNYTGRQIMSAANPPMKLALRCTTNRRTISLGFVFAKSPQPPKALTFSEV